MPHEGLSPFSKVRVRPWNVVAPQSPGSIVIASKKRTIVVGGGIAGLAAARTLQERGAAYAIMESAPTVGGLTRSIQADAFCFDYTGHLLHLQRVERPEELPCADLEGEDWCRIERKSACYVAGRLVTAPIQYNLSELPAERCREVLASFEARPAPPEGSRASFRDVVVSGFGQDLADLFLIPQNEKTMAIPLDRLSEGALKRFFPPPDETMIRNGARPGHVAPATYNTQFWYPKAGGIQALVHGLAKTLERPRLLDKATHLDLAGKSLTTASGKTWEWDTLLPSLPLNALCAMSSDPELREMAGQLSHSSTIVFNLGLETPVAEALGELQWVYVPDRAIPFYRVGVYSNICAGMCPPGHAALYVEVGVPHGALGEVDIHRDLEPRVLAALSELGWVDPGTITAKVVHVIPCAYVHHTPERERVLPRILEKLHACDVYPIGRYGQWDYTSMEDSIYSGIEAAERVL